MLGEVAWKVTLTPGPLRAFFERVRARRGTQVAATATARKLAVLFWHLLTREQDYAFARPAMTRNKIRRARAARRRATAERTARHRRRQIEGRLRRRTRALAPSRDRLPAPGQRLALDRPGESGCGRDTGARIFKALEGQSRAADSVSPKVCASLRQSPAPTDTLAKEPPPRSSTQTDRSEPLYRRASRPFRGRAHLPGPGRVGVRLLPARDRRSAATRTDRGRAAAAAGSARLHAANYFAYGSRQHVDRAATGPASRSRRCTVERLMRAHGIQGAKRRGKPLEDHPT